MEVKIPENLYKLLEEKILTDEFIKTNELKFNPQETSQLVTFFLKKSERRENRKNRVENYYREKRIDGYQTNS